MKATEANLLDLMGVAKMQFGIPVYQRVYSWSEKECEVLGMTSRELAVMAWRICRACALRACHLKIDNRWIISYDRGLDNCQCRGKLALQCLGHLR